MSRIFALVVLGRNLLPREGLVKIIESGPYEVVAAAKCPAELSGTLIETKPALYVLICDTWDATARDDIAEILRLHSGARILVVAHDCDVPALLDGFEHGISGFLTTAISSDVFLNALALVLSDVAVIPAGVRWQLMQAKRNCVIGVCEDVPVVALAEPFASQKQIHLSSPKPGLLAAQHDSGVQDFHGLSDREVSVLRYVAEGYANKLIARELDIAEATVKVHVKAILRKLGMQNRTQAAIWARELTAPKQATEIATLSASVPERAA